MKFSELSEDDILYIKDIYSSRELSWDERIYQLMKYLDKGERTTRKWLVKLGIKQKEQEDSPQYNQYIQLLLQDSKSGATFIGQYSADEWKDIDNFKKGEVLVTRATDPDWVPSQCMRQVGSANLDAPTTISK